MLNEKHSHRNYQDQDLSRTDPAEWSRSTVRGTSFYQQNHPELRRVLPEGVVDCVLERCNLDNCYVPEGFTIVGGSHRRIQVQNDGADWECDEHEKPVRPVNPDNAIQDPRDLPAEYNCEEEISKAQHDAGRWQTWFKAEPEIVSQNVQTVSIEVPTVEWDKLSAGQQVSNLEALRISMQTDARPVAVPSAERVKIQGTQTVYTVRGPTWRYRDEGK